MRPTLWLLALALISCSQQTAPAAPSLVPEHDAVAAVVLEASAGGFDLAHSNEDDLTFFPGAATCHQWGGTGTAPYAISIAFHSEGPGDYRVVNPRPTCAAADGGASYSCQASATLRVQGGQPIAGTGLLRLTSIPFRLDGTDLPDVGAVDILFRDGTSAWRLAGQFTGRACAME